MLDALQFVSGAISKKNLVSTLTHFQIEGGRITSSNGMVTLSSPIDLDIDVTPKADKFMRAVKNCDTTVSLNMAANGKLFIKSGSFKTYIECSEEPYPDIQPEGIETALNYDILDALRILEPFIGVDDSRRWSRGILLRGASAFATNNVLLVQYWFGTEFSTSICIPAPAVQELLRIGVEPCGIQIGDNSITFHFEGGRWLRVQAFNGDWPDIERVLDSAPNVTHDVPEGFFNGLRKLLPFVDDLSRVYFLNGCVSTTKEEDSGATVDIDVAKDGIYNVEQLLLLENVATTINFNTYPAPSPFYGENVRGVLVGMKV